MSEGFNGWHCALERHDARGRADVYITCTGYLVAVQRRLDLQRNRSVVDRGLRALVCAVRGLFGLLACLLERLAGRYILSTRAGFLCARRDREGRREQNLQAPPSVSVSFAVSLPKYPFCRSISEAGEIRPDSSRYRFGGKRTGFGKVRTGFAPASSTLHNLDSSAVSRLPQSDQVLEPKTVQDQDHHAIVSTCGLSLAR